MQIGKRIATPLALFVLGLAAPLEGQVAGLAPAPGGKFHADRRKELMKRVGGGVILVRGAGRTETYQPFYQNHSFYYLTGIKEPDCDLLLIPKTGEEFLFVPPYSPFTALWEGVGVLPGKKGSRQTGIEKVAAGRPDSKTLLDALKSALGRCGKQKAIHVEFQPEETGAASRDRLRRTLGRWRTDLLDRRISRNNALRDGLEREFYEIEQIDLSPHLDSMRTIKRPEEIEVLAYAARLACLGIAEAIKACRPGQLESELAAVAEYAYKRHGAQGIGYMPIVGSGPNSCVLHHWRNDRKMQKGDIVVMDFAPDVNCYVADVTRTFPVSGKFSRKQRKLVQDVHDAQQAMIRAIKPGMTFAQIERIGRKLLTGRGYKRIHIKHGSFHHLGMAVHDVRRGARELREGMYITVEPGIYFTREGMGCRIEDDVLITANGCRVLSTGCPSDPDGIERLMKLEGLALPPTGAREIERKKKKL